MHPVATGLALLLSKLRLLQGASFSGSARGLSLVKDGPAVYRPRHPERSTFYQILDQHFDRYVALHEERFEPKAGPLRSIVRPVVEAFLDCGQLKNGFARLRCGSCAAEHLIAFSCGSRNFCPSCQAKRSVFFAENLTPAGIESTIPRLHARLRASPLFGPLLRDWEVHHGVRISVKVTALTLMVGIGCTSIFLLEAALPWRIALGAVLLVGVGVVLRLRTLRE